jgi:L-ribulose-5-phosphate 3-epimerase
MIPPFRLAYNSNGLAHHRLLDALPMLAEIGYGGMAITPDAGHLDPYALDAGEVAAVRRRADQLELTLTVETGARFVLDPWIKHGPNLMDTLQSGRTRRVDFYRRCIDLAVALEAPVVSLWAGAEPEGHEWSQAPAALRERLAEGLERVLEHARAGGVRIGFEPEPGMFIERPSGFAELRELMGARGEGLGLTLDVGHLVVTGDRPEAAVIRAFADDLVQVHLDDCPVGVHEHRAFGEGDLDLLAVLEALIEVGFSGQAAVELSRDSHRAPQAAEDAMRALRTALDRLEDRKRVSRS